MVGAFVLGNFAVFFPILLPLSWFLQSLGSDNFQFQEENVILCVTDGGVGVNVCPACLRTEGWWADFAGFCCSCYSKIGFH